MIDKLEKSFGKILIDRINTDFHWIPLTKFSFHPIDGHIDLRLTARENQLKFVLLNEEEWKNDLAKTCLKNELILNEQTNATNTWSLSRSLTDIDLKYLILIKCNQSIDISNGSYHVILTNGKDIFTEQFSNEERGILGLFIASTCIYPIIFLVVTFKCIYWSNVKTLIIQLYLLSIVCSWLNSLISLILTLMFALIGNDQTILYRLLEFLARFCHLLAQILFLFALILSVNGYFINRIQWRRKPMIQIQIFMLLYTIIQIIIIILMTIATTQVIPNENLLLICDCIQMVMYTLTGFWFVISILTFKGNLIKEVRSFIIFILWFFIHALVLLLNIFDVISEPHMTILRSIQIGIQCFGYIVFSIIIRYKTCFFRTKLNQINITYIDPTPMKGSVIDEKQTNHPSNELTDLNTIDRPWTWRFRFPMKSIGPLPRLEPRRDVLANTLMQSTMNRNQPSSCHVPRRLPALNHDVQ